MYVFIALYLVIIVFGVCLILAVKAYLPEYMQERHDVKRYSEASAFAKKLLTHVNVIENHNLINNDYHRLKVSIAKHYLHLYLDTKNYYYLERAVEVWSDFLSAAKDGFD